jgi:hypothetical protein
MRIITAFTFILFMLGTFLGNAQVATKTSSDKVKNRLVITSENELFTIYLNSKKVTPKPGIKHTLENLDQKSYDIKIEFFRNQMPITKKLDIKDGKELIYKLSPNSTGKFGLRFEKENNLTNNKNQKDKASLTGATSPAGAKATKPEPKKTHNNRIIIYSDKELFSVYLNNKKVTPKPGIKHTLENLDQESYNIKIEFFRNQMPITKKLDIKDGKELIYKLSPNSTGKFGLRFEKENDLANNNNQKDKANLTGSGSSGSAIVTKPEPKKTHNNRIIIYNDKELFTLFLNSKQVTPKPGIKHTLENLDRQSYDLKIDFFRKHPSISKKLIVKEGVESIYILKKTSSGKYAFMLEKENDLNSSKPKEKDKANLTGSGSSGSATVTKPEPKKTHNNRIIIHNDKELFTVFLNSKQVTPKPGIKHTLENLDRQSYDLKIDFLRNYPSITKKLIVKEGVESIYILKKTSSGKYAFMLEKENDLNSSKPKEKDKANLTGSGSSGSATVTKPEPKKTHNNRIIIHNDKELFTVFLNSKQVTPKPGIKHTLENLDRQSYDLKIDFLRNYPSITKKLIVKEGVESIYILKKTSSGKYAFMLEKENDLNGKEPKGKDKSNLTGSGSSGSGTVTKPPHNNKKPDKPAVGGKPNSSGSNTSGQTTTEPAINTNVNVSSKDCGMNLQDYRAAVISISNRSTDNAKLTMAKQVSENHCLTVSQIKVIMEQFSTDKAKVDFAKFAYLKCDNRTEYYKVNDAFSSEGSISELDKYIQTKKF